MAQKRSNTIEKIYSLKTVGFTSVANDFVALEKLLQKLKQAKVALNNTKGKIVDAGEIEDTNRKIDSVTKKQAEVISKSVGAYAQLIAQYKEAKTNAEDMAAEFGIESEQAKLAAASLADYRSQLEAIKNLIKGTSKKTAPTSPTDIVSTDNIADVNAEIERTARAAGVAVNDLEIAEAQAANAATAWVESQVLGTNSLDDFADALGTIKTPYEEYTGSLQQNIKQHLEYTSRLKQITKEKKLAGADTAKLAQEEVFLKKAAAELSQTINAQVKYIQAAEGSMDQLNAQLGLGRNLYRQLSDEEKAGSFGVQLNQEITALDTNLKKADASIGNHQRNVGNYTGAISNFFGKTFGFLKNLAYLLPGIGIAGILGIITEGITALVSEIFKGSTATNTWKENLSNLNSMMSEANKQAGKEISALKQLYQAAVDVNLPMEERLEAVQDLKKEYPVYFSQLSNEAILTGQAAIEYKNLTTEILASTKARAATAKLADIESKKLDVDFQKQKVRNAVANEKARAKTKNTPEVVATDEFGRVVATNTVDDQLKTIDNRVEKALAKLETEMASLEAQSNFILKNVASAKRKLPDATANLSQNELNLLIKNIDEQISVLKEGDPKLKELESQRISFQKRVDAFANKAKPFNGSRLSGEDKDALKRLESHRLEELEIEETAANKILKVREFTFDEERDYNLRIEKINIDALNKKIEYLNKKKSLNAEEELQLIKFGKEISEIELQTSKKLQDIEKRRFAEKERLLKNELEKSIQDAKDTNDQVQENVNSKPSERADAQLAADQKVLTAQEKFYNELLKLNDDYNNQALVLALKGIATTKKQIAKDTKEISLSTLADIDKETEEALTAIRLKYDQLKKEILASNKSTSDKNAAIGVLEKVEAVKVAGDKQKGENKKVAAAKELLDLGLITAAQYEEIYQKANKGQQELNNTIEAGKKSITGFSSLVESKLSKAFGFAPNSDKSKLLAQTISDAFATAGNAMNTYFDLESQRIQDSLRLQQARLDKEKEMALAGAQSQAERDSIEKQFAAKKEAAERAAFEKNKKLQKQQAKINLAIQLSNLAVIAFAPNPLNIATLGAAGAVMYALQAALALANYAVNVGRINSATFEKGGEVLTKKGGRAKGPSHAHGGIPFNYEAEGGELFIVNKKSARDNRVRTLTGTNAQIASMINELGGGVRFAPGASMFKKLEYGGSLGMSLQPPVFTPSKTIITTSNDAKLDELIEVVKNNSDAIKEHAKETAARIDRLEVRQVTSSVSAALKKEVQQKNVGTF